MTQDEYDEVQARLRAAINAITGSRWMLDDLVVTVERASPFLVALTADNPKPGHFAKWTMPRVQFLNLAKPLALH